MNNTLPERFEGVDEGPSILEEDISVAPAESVAIGRTRGHFNWKAKLVFLCAALKSVTAPTACTGPFGLEEDHTKGPDAIACLDTKICDPADTPFYIPDGVEPDPEVVADPDAVVAPDADATDSADTDSADTDSADTDSADTDSDDTGTADTDATDTGTADCNIDTSTPRCIKVTALSGEISVHNCEEEENSYLVEALAANSISFCDIKDGLLYTNESTSNIVVEVENPTDESLAIVVFPLLSDSDRQNVACDVPQGASGAIIDVYPGETGVINVPPDGGFVVL